MRIGGWQRVGIVASVAWVICGGMYQHLADWKEARETAFAVGEVCFRGLSANATTKAVLDCGAREVQLRDTLMGDDGLNVALMAFGPLPLAWLAAYVSRGVWRWVRAGFVRVP
jgi:hypothetical protein